MTGLILKNGFIYDPINGINGEKGDILIKDGIIVDRLNERRAKVMDVSGKIVMPGGIEIHSHVAGGKVNGGRSLRPEDHVRFIIKKTRITRSGSGFSTPSTFITGYLYSKMGYTTVFTPAMPPLVARHTHEELHDIPMVDKAAYTLCDGNWFLMTYLKEGQVEKAAAYAAWLLKATKGLVIKLTNPGGTEAWGWGRDCRDLDDPVPHFDITPREIIKGMVEVNELLGLPHSIHLHANNLGRLGNYSTTVETFEVPHKVKAPRGRQTLHIAHVQFNSYGGDTWPNFESRAEEIAKGVDRNNVVVDTGNVTLDETTTMTADGPMEYYLQSISHLKWANRNVELETSPGITPFVYSPKMKTPSIQWAIGLELPLLVKDSWKVLLSTDHPNGGPFIRYPRILAWLMSAKYREKTLSQINNAAMKQSLLPTIDREYGFYEVAVLTRAGQARALGLEESKGHLGPGAQGDVAVYDIDPEKVDPSNDYEEIEEKFSRAYLTVKDGQVVVRKGEIVKVINGRTYWSKPQVNEKLEKEVLKDIDYYFKRYYSINLANYPVGEDYLTQSTPIVTQGEAS
jgi:formylmethanofuran dehydrogenase subunit A